MLQAEKLFLPCYFLAQFLLRRHIEHIFRGEQPVVVVQHGVAGDVLVGFRTKDDTDSRVVALAPYPLVVHPDIHIHLPHVLVRDGRRFEVDQHERFKDVIVENEVDEVVLFLCADQFLTRHEREALTQFLCQQIYYAK